MISEKAGLHALPFHISILGLIHFLDRVLCEGVTVRLTLCAVNKGKKFVMLGILFPRLMMHLSYYVN